MPLRDRKPCAFIKPGKYRHYKGKLYEVIALAHHSETEEPLVVYKALYQTKYGRNSWWVRPQAMFMERIVIDGKEMPRFKYINNRERVLKRRQK